MIITSMFLICVTSCREMLSDATTQQSQPTFHVCLVNIDCRIKSHTKWHCWNFMQCDDMGRVCRVWISPPPYTHTTHISISTLQYALLRIYPTRGGYAWKPWQAPQMLYCLIRCISPKKSTSAAGEWPGSCREKDSPLWPDSSIADPSRGG